MRKIKIIIMLSIIGSLILMLSGCESIVLLSTPGKNRAFAFNTNNNKKIGLVAFSVQCIGYNEPLQITVSSESGGLRNALINPAYPPINVHCSDGSPQYIMLKLKPDNYAVIDISPAGMYDEEFKPFYFKVYAGKVNYIGNLLIKYVGPKQHKFRISDIFNTPGLGGIRYVVIDSSKQDIPIFHAKFSNVALSHYVVNIMQRDI
jgi:hypothetical protein